MFWMKIIHECVVVFLSLTKYEILSTVVDVGSLTKAATLLGLTQSAVSHAISSLEIEWGFSLLIRDRSGIRITSNGERVLKHIRNILQNNEQLKQEVAAINGLNVGTIRIGTFTSVSTQWLPGIIKDFQFHYPSIQIKLVEADHYYEIEQWLQEGSIDFGFLATPFSKSLEFIPLKKDRIRCVLSSNHPLSGKSVISFEDIKNQPFIMPKWGTGNDFPILLKKQNESLQVKYEVADDQAIISMVRHGLGITILPEMVLYNFLNDITVIDLEEDYYRTIGITALSFQKLSPAAKQYIKSVRSWLRQQMLLDYDN